MIYNYEVKYSHLSTPNHYNAYYHGELIGTVRYTPEAAGTWTFETDRIQTFGSTRLQAVGFYVEQFMKRGEGNNGKEVGIVQIRRGQD